MAFELKLTQMDLDDNEMTFNLSIKDNVHNRETFKITPDELDLMILELKKARILVHGLEAAKKANAQALNSMAKSEEVTVVRNILIDDLKQKSEAKTEETPA
jgi:hypothetical protein